MCGNEANDMFSPTVWATEKVRHFWHAVAGQNLVDHIRQMEGYVVGAVTGQHCIRLTGSERRWSTHNVTFTNFPGLWISIR